MSLLCQRENYSRFPFTPIFVLRHTNFLIDAPAVNLCRARPILKRQLWGLSCFLREEGRSRRGCLSEPSSSNTTFSENRSRAFSLYLTKCVPGRFSSFLSFHFESYFPSKPESLVADISKLSYVAEASTRDRLAQLAQKMTSLEGKMELLEAQQQSLAAPPR